MRFFQWLAIIMDNSRYALCTFIHCRSNLPSQMSINTSNNFYIGCYQALVSQGNRNIGFSIRETTLKVKICMVYMHASTLYVIEISLEMCTVIQFIAFDLLTYTSVACVDNSSQGHGFAWIPCRVTTNYHQLQSYYTRNNCC